MNKDYGSHTIPPPVIKMPMSALEDARGALLTSHTLLGFLCNHIEGMQTQLNSIARSDTGIASGVYYGQLIGDLEAAWALTDAIESRVKDDLVLIDAIVDHEASSRRRPNTIAFDAAVAAYHEATAVVLPEEDPGHDASIDAATVAFENLLDHRAPTHDALLQKLAIIEAECGHNNAQAAQSVLFDVQVLGGGIEG